MEDDFVRHNQNASTSDRLALRPGYGTKGKQILLRSNFFEVLVRDTAVYYIYKIIIKPEKPPKRHQKEIFERLMGSKRVIDADGVTDGAAELVTLKQLKELDDMNMGIGGNGNSEGQKAYKVSTKPAGSINHKMLLDAIKNKGISSKVTDEDVAIRVLNILLAGIPQKDPGTVITGKTRNKYFWMDDRKQVASLGGGLECVRGYYSSVRIGTGRLLLNLNVNHSAFFLPGDLSTLVKEFADVFGQDVQLLNRYIRGVRIEVTHLPKDKDANGKESYRQKSIWGLASHRDGARGNHPSKVPRLGATPNEVQFYMEDRDRGTGRYVTVTDYFKQRKCTLELPPLRRF